MPERSPSFRSPDDGPHTSGTSLRGSIAEPLPPMACRPFLGDVVKRMNWSHALVLARHNTPWITPVAWKLVAAVGLAQSMLGVCQGTIGEIGVHHGAGLALLAALADRSETIWLTDLFDRRSNLDRSGNADEVMVHATVRRIANRSVGQVLRMSSTQLCGDHRPASPFWVLHVDGSHISAVALSDLRWASAAIAEFGVVIMDDVGHGRWLGPGRAVRAFFSLFDGYSLLRPLAYAGKKLVLCRPRAHAPLLDALKRGSTRARGFGFGLRLTLEAPERLALSSKDPTCRAEADATLARAEAPCSLPPGNFSVAVL